MTLFDVPGFAWRLGSIDEANSLLARAHYLGPIYAGGARIVWLGAEEGRILAAQVWRTPTARFLPSDGTWLELSRWCLTPEAGPNAGSRQHAAFVRWARQQQLGISTLVSYSDPSRGHTGALYRACNWRWAPTWHRLRPPPTGNGSWDGATDQSVKNRWIFEIARDPRREEILSVKDDAIMRKLASA